MATPTGVGLVSSLSRTYVLPYVVDNLYKSNVVFFRLNSANKKDVQGGTQIEVPLLYTRFAAGGWVSGYDVFDTSPSDPVKSAAFDWKELVVPLTFSRLDLVKMNAPDKILSGVKVSMRVAEMEAAEWLGIGTFSTGTNPKMLDGIPMGVDDGTVAATYGGLLRSANTWWKAQRDASTTTLTLAKLQAMYGACSEGGRHPTLIASTQANYDRYHALLIAKQEFMAQQQVADEQLGNAGFTNLLYNGTPWVVDSHVPTDHIFFLNEDYWTLVVAEGLDFYFEDWVKPANQNAYTATLNWVGGLVCENPSRNGVMTAVAA